MTLLTYHATWKRDMQNTSICDRGLSSWLNGKHSSVSGHLRFIPVSPDVKRNDLWSTGRRSEISMDSVPVLQPHHTHGRTTKTSTYLITIARVPAQALRPHTSAGFANLLASVFTSHVCNKVSVKTFCSQYHYAVFVYICYTFR